MAHYLVIIGLHKEPHITVFLDHKAHFKSFNFLKNWKCTLQCGTPDVWIWLWFLTLDQFYVVNDVIYLIASYDVFVNTPSCYIISHQQLQWTVHVVPWAASTYLTFEAQVVLLFEATA